MRRCFMMRTTARRDPPLSARGFYGMKCPEPGHSIIESVPTGDTPSLINDFTGRTEAL